MIHYISLWIKHQAQEFSKLELLGVNDLATHCLGKLLGP